MKLKKFFFFISSSFICLIIHRFPLILIHAPYFNFIIDSTLHKIYIYNYYLNTINLQPSPFSAFWDFKMKWHFLSENHSANFETVVFYYYYFCFTTRAKLKFFFNRKNVPNMSKTFSYTKFDYNRFTRSAYMTHP